MGDFHPALILPTTLITPSGNARDIKSRTTARDVDIVADTRNLKAIERLKPVYCTTNPRLFMKRFHGGLNGVATRYILGPPQIASRLLLR